MGNLSKPQEQFKKTKNALSVVCSSKSGGNGATYFHQLSRFYTTQNKPKTTYYLWFALALLLLVAVGCNGRPLSTSSDFVAGGNPQAGWQAVQDYGCQTCHAIPGIPGPEAYVGPPLQEWPARSYIAGTLSNTPDNLTEWIRFPQEIEPGTAMPNLDVTEEDARNISAYLFDLRE